MTASPYFDTLETRDPAEREAALLAALPATDDKPLHIVTRGAQTTPNTGDTGP